MKYDIYFHNDFDGFGGAAIMYAFLRDRGDEVGHFVPVDFDLSAQWMKIDFFENHKLFKGRHNPAVVIDFPFHPRAAWYFDHHPTSFKKAEWKKKFRQTKRWVFDAKYLSAGHLVYAALKKNFKWKPPAHFTDFVKWLDVVDGARYKSAKQTIEMKEPALQIGRIIEKDHPHVSVKELVELLAARPLKQLVREPHIEKDIAMVLCEKAEGMKFARAHARKLGDRAVYIYYPSRKAVKLRYAPFYLYPRARYGIRLSRGNSAYHLSVGVNPWNKPKNGPHIGELVARYGGGGHKNIGGVEFKTKAAADEAIREIVAMLNKK